MNTKEERYRRSFLINITLLTMLNVVFIIAVIKGILSVTYVNKDNISAEVIYNSDLTEKDAEVYPAKKEHNNQEKKIKHKF